MAVGKVHGSLARAGKVRGQTPKVPKQEKKKKPTGRAMKRIKYNRRFVNVGAWLVAHWISAGAAGPQKQQPAIPRTAVGYCAWPVLAAWELGVWVLHGTRPPHAAIC